MNKIFFLWGEGKGLVKLAYWFCPKILECLELFNYIVGAKDLQWVRTADCARQDCYMRV